MLTAPLVAQNVRTPAGRKRSCTRCRPPIRLLLSTRRPASLSGSGPSTAPWNPAQRQLDLHEHVDGNAGHRQGGLTIYMISADGRLHGLDISTGEAKLIPPPEFVTPYSRNWSLNLIDGVLYTSVGRGCGNGPVPGAPAPPPGTLRGGGGAGGIQRRRAKRPRAQRGAAMRRPRVPEDQRRRRHPAVRPQEGAAVVRRRRRLRRT